VSLALKNAGIPLPVVISVKPAGLRLRLFHGERFSADAVGSVA